MASFAAGGDLGGMSDLVEVGVMHKESGSGSGASSELVSVVSVVSGDLVSNLVSGFPPVGVAEGVGFQPCFKVSGDHVFSSVSVINCLRFHALVYRCMLQRLPLIRDHFQFKDLNLHCSVQSYLSPI